jgi:hypothetical protein
MHCGDVYTEGISGCTVRIEVGVYRVKTGVSSDVRLIPHPAESESLKGFRDQECRDPTTVITEVIENLLNVGTHSVPSQEIIRICYTCTHIRIKRHVHIWTGVCTQKTQPNDLTKACFGLVVETGRCLFSSLRRKYLVWGFRRYECHSCVCVVGSD